MSSNKTELIFGIHVVMQLLLTNPKSILEIFISHNKQLNKENDKIIRLMQLAKTHNIDIIWLEKSKLDQWCNNQTHQGVAAKIYPNEVGNENDLTDIVKNNKSPLFLILDGIQDPHNLGACLRSADAAGVTAVIIPKDKSCNITATVRKSASGATETVKLIQVTNLSRTIKYLQEHGIWIVGTCNEPQAQLLFELNLTGAIAIVLGSEGNGMRALTKKNCDFLAKIPMFGAIESLNISVAAGICLYEAVRQRQLSVN